jgi:hypothetical protein
MDKDSSFLMWLDEAKERKIHIADDFALDVVGQGVVTYQHGKIVDIYHVPKLNANLFFISQLTQIGKIIEFWPYRFYVCDLKKGKSIFVGGILDLKNDLYKFGDVN